MPLANQILHQLDRVSGVSGWVVALSGGADSTALLLALNSVKDQLNSDIRAIHVNHNLQTQSHSWSIFCQQLCEQHQIPYQSIEVTIHKEADHSIESSARKTRYAALLEQLNPDEVLLTAHHQNDQAETVLLNLFRGSGLSGLSGIPQLRKQQQRRIFRPLLNIPRSTLVSFLESREQDWITDPMNLDTDYNRSFLRETILPEIQTRWPAAQQKISEAAHHIRSADQWINAHIQTIYQNIATQTEYALDISKLIECDDFIQGRLIRLWFTRNQYEMPSRQHIAQISAWIKHQPTRRQAQLCVSNWCVYRFKNLIILSAKSTILNEEVIHWQTDQPLELSHNSTLHWKHPTTLNLEVSGRKPGLKLKPVKDHHHRTIKSLFQSQQIPPWVRKRIPHIFYQNKLVALGDICIDDDFESQFPGAIHWVFSGLKQIK